MVESINQTQVNLDGLLEILGKNLYSSPSVALRELVQNAHDACVRYQIETDKTKAFQISLDTDASRNILEITDNGSGLTRDEIQDYLATVGSGYTRVLRNATDSEHMIGYFGLGFLSAYVVTKKVEVFTTSYKTPRDTWRFSSAGGKTFSVSKSQPLTVGTKVRLYLDDDYNGLATESMLYSLIKKYCSLLEIPIVINQAASAANGLQPPWRLSSDVSALQKKKTSLAFAQVFENDFEPICCIPIPENNPYQLKGVLWIQDGASYASSDNRNVSVFIRNMFITKDELELLPRWAGFVGAVFESVNFSPTASRESLQKDGYFKEVAAYIKEQLIVGLRNVVLQEPETWRRILVKHAQSLLGAAISDDRLFEVCRKSLKVPTSLGEMTLPQLLTKSQGNVYIKPGLESGFEETLFRARLIPVVSGYLYGAFEFCRMYAALESCAINILGDPKDEANIFPRISQPAEKQRQFEVIFLRENEELIFTNIEPAHVPLVIVEDSDVKLKNKLEQDDADKRIGSAALSLARLTTKKINKAKERRVYVNLNNSVITKLSNSAPTQQVASAKLLRSFIDAMNVSTELEKGDFSDTLVRFNQSFLELIG